MLSRATRVDSGPDSFWFAKLCEKEDERGRKRKRKEAADR
jgi:hypothetical protein